MSDKTSQSDKIDQTISALIDQLDYLVTDIQIDKKKRDKTKYDTTKDKIRAESDVVWQISAALTNLVSLKQHLSATEDKITSLVEMGLGTTPKGDK